jgi:hypothetical protein
MFSDPGAERLNTAVPEFKDAAASLAEGANNPSMAYTSTAAEISIDDSLDVIQNLLYRTEGYVNAIALGNKLVKTSAVKVARYWYLMAAAYGQKHHALTETVAPEREQRLARLAVLEAARKAVQLSPNLKMRLSELTDANSYDNDLQDFVDDVDFWRIVK